MFNRQRFRGLLRGLQTVRKDACGCYFVAFACEETVETLPATGKALGIDWGIGDVAVGGEWKSGNPRHLKRHLKRQQRALSRKQKGSRGVRRRRAVARIHARIADLGMGEFRRQVEDEAAGYERESRVADCWAPTRKTCSACGSLRDKMPLRVREWTCPDGGARHDRDVNAARNIVKSSTAGEAGFEARGAGQNGSGQLSGTRDEARTDANKSDDADRMDRAASSEGADSKRGSKGHRSAGCPFF